MLSKDYDLMINDITLLFPESNCITNANEKEMSYSFNGIKVLYSCGKAARMKLNDMCKLPLQYDDLHAIRSLLAYRQHYFGQSMVKNYYVSCLITN